MKITRKQLRRLIFEAFETQNMEEGIMDFFRSKDPVDVAFREVKEYIEDTSKSAQKGAQATLSQNIKMQTLSPNFISQNFDRRNIDKMKSRIEPVQVRYSTGDSTGREVSTLQISLVPDARRKGREPFSDMRLTYPFEFYFDVTKVAEDQYEVLFRVVSPQSSAGASELPRELGSQVAELVAQKIGQDENHAASGENLLSLLMSRARFIIDILPSLYRFIIADTYIDYRYDDSHRSAPNVFNDVLSPAYNEINSKQVRST